MAFTATKREEIKSYIIHLIGQGQYSGKFDKNKVLEKYGVSEQTVFRYLRDLEGEGRIMRQRYDKKSYRYELPKETTVFHAKIQGLQEDVVWARNFAKAAEAVPDNARRICTYIFTEMLNNVIDHSDGDCVNIVIDTSEACTMIAIKDDGIGIFNKISKAMNLPEKRFAVLELAKGKFTTEPQSHTGEGIFFSTKAADDFAITSDGIFFTKNEDIDAYYGAKGYVVDNTTSVTGGTCFIFVVFHLRDETLTDVFAKYTEHPDGYGFNQTTVPVRLLEYGNSSPDFISRSQAKRLIARFEKFSSIILDFDGVDEIGQGFADEIFRVFTNLHPEITLTTKNCTAAVARMIGHAGG